MPNAFGENSKKNLLCFIDDSPQERELFEEVFGADQGYFQVICAPSLDEAQTKIAQIERIPDLFVLDLYFPGGEDSPPSTEDLREPVAFIEDGGNLAEAYLNLETARRRYQTLRILLGQSPAGGFKLIEQVQEAFPGVPIVTYTRKGTIEEAEMARRAGARRVLQKPSGENWEATRRLTRERRLDLEQSFRQAMGQDPYEILTLIVHYANRLTELEDLGDLGREALDLRRKLQERAEPIVHPDEFDRLMESTHHPFIRALIFQLRP